VPPLDTGKLAKRLSKRLARGEDFERASTAVLKSMATAGGDPEFFEGVEPRTADYLDVREADSTSPAYDAAMKAARKMAERNNITIPQAFSAIWTSPENHQMTRDDHQHHMAKATRALALPGSTGPGLRPDQEPTYRKPIRGDGIAEEIVKAVRKGASFEIAASAALRRRAA
jgi:hypothetical protein